MGVGILNTKHYFGDFDRLYMHDFHCVVSPVLMLQVTLVTFVTYVTTGSVLDAGTAFSALSLLNILRFPIIMLPMMVSFLVMVSYA